MSVRPSVHDPDAPVRLSYLRELHGRRRLRPRRGADDVAPQRKHQRGGDGGGGERARHANGLRVAMHACKRSSGSPYMPAQPS